MGKSHFKRLLQRQGRRDDFTENPPDAFVRKGAGITSNQAFIDRFLTTRHIVITMALLFGLPDLYDDFCTTIAHVEDLIIECINTLS